MTLKPLGEVRTRLREEAVRLRASPRDVDLLLSDLMGRSVSWVLAHGDELIDPEPITTLAARRFSGEPLQYIRGRTEFYSREFLVDRRVLIPRPETETLVETALAMADDGAKIVDIGTGSGCIAISIERSRPDVHVTAVDLSIDALAVARANRHRLGSNVSLVASDFLASISGRFDLIVSNPPYIPAADVDGLATEVRDFEPRLALTPGPAGTEAISRILAAARDHLTPAGRVILEIGYGQSATVRGLGEAAGFAVERVIPDLAGIDRVVVLSRREPE